MERFVALIMAGGVGQRFWPLSTADRPKQFLDLERKGRSLLQATFDRLLLLTNNTHDIFVITGQNYKSLVHEQLPELPLENILIEPEGRDTAPAIALATLEIQQRFANPVMGVFPSDHRVGNVSAFLEICQKAIEQAHHTNGLITLGIEPTHPATGYGYIERAEDCQNNVYKVNQFVEKPPLEKAKVYISNQRFSWNGGIFFWHVNTILNEFALHAPVLLNPLSNAYKTGKIANVFSSLPKISIDYAVLEKTTNAYVIPSSFDWDDLGDWQALERLLQKEHTDLNTVIGQHVGLETTGNIIYNENADDMIVTLGIENLVIIKRQNAMLLVHKDKIQDIKHLLKDERLSHFVLR